MKTYTFWSGDTTYFTKYKSLKKAQAVGRENMELYLETCKYLGEEPEADENHFIPEEVDQVTKGEMNYSVKHDPDITMLDF